MSPNTPWSAHMFADHGVFGDYRQQGKKYKLPATMIDPAGEHDEREPFKYWAFISYSHRDARWAKWLHRHLETYRLPAKLMRHARQQDPLPRRIAPVFRDQDELPTSADLGQSITEALGSSRHLIVVCSPHAAQSRWVNEEILLFQRIGRSDRVHCLIVDGEPNASDIPELAALECFPPAARGTGEQSEVRFEPLAADARPSHDTRHDAMLRLIAGMLGIGFDELKRRELQRRLRRLLGVVASTMILTVIMAGLALAAYLAKREADFQRSQAVAARQDAEQAKRTAEAERDNARFQLGRKYWTDALVQRDAHHQPIVASHLFTLAAAQFEKSPADSRNAQLAADVLVHHLRLQHVLEQKPIVERAVYSPHADRVLSWGGKSFRLWDATTGELLVELEHGDKHELPGGAVFNRDGNRVLTWGFFSAARLWDTNTGELLIELADANNVRGALFDKNESRILAWGSGGTTWLWDAKTGVKLIELQHDGIHVQGTDFDPFEETIRPAPVNGAVFNADESRILTWSDDGNSRLWNATTGVKLFDLRHGDILADNLIGSNENGMRPAPVSGAVFNQDESRVLTWSEDDTARLWDANTGASLAQFQHEGDVVGATFDKFQRRVLTWSRDGSVRLWNAETGDVLTKFEHGDRVFGAVFNRDESRLLSWSADGTAQLWDVNSGLALVKCEHGDWVYGAKFNRDESRILSWTGGDTAQLWDVQAGQPVAAFQHTGSISGGPTFDSDESHILGWSGESVMIWDAQADQTLVECEHQAPVIDAVFNPDERRVLSWTDADSAKLWDVDTGETLAGIPGAPVFNTDRSRVLSRSDNVVRILDTSTGATLTEFQHERTVDGAALSRDGRRVASWTTWIDASPDRWKSHLFIWDVATNAVVVQFQLDGQIDDAVFNHDASRILGWGRRPSVSTHSEFDGSIWHWNATTGQLLVEFESGKVYGALFSKDEGRVWSWSIWTDEMRRELVVSTATLWNAKSGARLMSLSYDGGIDGPTFNHDASRILHWSKDDPLRLLDATTGEAVVVFEQDAKVDDAVFDQNESRVFGWSFTGTPRLWDAQTGKLLREFDRGAAGSGAAFSLDGRLLLSWNSIAAELWDISTGKTVFRYDYRGNNFGAVFSRDASRILSWSGNSARLWDAKTGVALVEFKHHGPVAGARFSRDERRVLSWSEDGTARLWNIDTDYDWPRPLLELRLEVFTGTQLDDLGHVQPLTRTEWLDRKRRCETISNKH